MLSLLRILHELKVLEKVQICHQGQIYRRYKRNMLERLSNHLDVAWENKLLVVYDPE